jgi:hypothetical protein
MTTCNKYDDCESCAFGGQDHAICEECDDADQWEPGFEDSLDAGSQNIIKFKKRSKEEIMEKMYA